VVIESGRSSADFGLAKGKDNRGEARPQAHRGHVYQMMGHQALLTNINSDFRCMLQNSLGPADPVRSCSSAPVSVEIFVGIILFPFPSFLDAKELE
jgi:hypothetical protein